ncbi:M23 family metallopeptidase [Protaetiibacter intestinalis]|uniref:M23 family metallopeptidase n=1 Tax=Protaetiibacter intestinalis TaxID=2419774 RepID=A0A387BCR5_9MICO|nr:M23 family metallopeptidase [Protaetiibacter intestinalis]AYF98669.1 M23 family metallopeptidase [Protaetiibacter intestinalis]
MPHPSSPVHASAHLHAPLRGFLAVSRRTLAIGTLALIMALVVVHDLPASATTVAAPEVELEGQELNITMASVTSKLSAPVTEERDGYDVITYSMVQWPVDPSSTVTAGFGHRSAPCVGCSTNHSGVDWTPGYGTPVHAIADGVVVARSMSDWGSYVVMQHDIDGQTVYSGYAHLVSGSNVPVGTVVSRGDVIGLIGNTGPTSGTHLHFSIIVDENTFVDPLAWLRTHVTEAWAG